MHTFTFTDNRPVHKDVLVLTAEQLAKHLAKDLQFMFYFRKEWDPRQQAIRSLHLYPPSDKALVWPQINEEQWAEVSAAIESLDRNELK